jgi:hypothetical protein
VSGQGGDPKLGPDWRDPNGLLRQVDNHKTELRSLISRKGHLSQVLHYSRLRVQLLRELPVPDAPTKACLAKPNRRYSTRVEAYITNILRIFAIPLVLAAALILVLVASEISIIFHPDDNEALTTLAAIGVLFIALRRITDRVPTAFDWRQKIAGLSLIPIILGFVAGASLLVVGVLLESIWKNAASQAQAIKLIGISFLQAAVILPTLVAALLLTVSIFAYMERRIRRALVPDLGIIAALRHETW